MDVCLPRVPHADTNTNQITSPGWTNSADHNTSGSWLFSFPGTILFLILKVLSETFLQKFLFNFVVNTRFALINSSPMFPDIFNKF